MTLVAGKNCFKPQRGFKASPRNHFVAALNKGEMTTFFTDLASVVEPVEIHFLWRPALADAADEMVMVLEAAINGQADMLATFNARHFAPARDRFNRLKIAAPREALREIERSQRR